MADKQTNWFSRHKVLTVILAFVAIGIISAATGGTKATTNTQTATPNPTPTQTTSDSRWDPAVYYDKLQVGMTKAEVETLIGKISENCSTTDSPGIGKMEYCSYGHFTDKGSLGITYADGKLYSKTKTSY